jgi:hypothetical protein
VADAQQSGRPVRLGVLAIPEPGVVDQLFPGAAVILSVLALNLVGDGLRDFLDPRLRYSA